MNVQIIKAIQLLLLSMISIQSATGLSFCDHKSFDSVFNIGHLIYFIRCGDIWTYDPRLNGGRGVFFKDWTLFAYARHFFGVEVTKLDGWKFRDNLLKFNGFSFQEINCITSAEDLQKSCYRSAERWDRLTVLFDTKSAVPFYYNQTIRVDTKDINPMGWKSKQPFVLTGDRFLPQVETFIAKSDNKYREFVAGLYDPNQDILYMGLKYKEMYCITHLSMKKMIHNVNEWPSAKPWNWSPEWRLGKCFQGNLIGMFYIGYQAYVVGRVLYSSRVYEDQVYTMTATADEDMIDIEEVYIRVGNKSDGKNTPDMLPSNLRTFFGCPVNSGDSNGRRKRSALAFDDLPKTYDIVVSQTQLSIPNTIVISMVVLATMVSVIVLLSLFVAKNVAKDKNKSN